MPGSCLYCAYLYKTSQSYLIFQIFQEPRNALQFYNIHSNITIQNVKFSNIRHDAITIEHSNTMLELMTEIGQSTFSPCLNNETLTILPGEEYRFYGYYDGSPRTGCTKGFSTAVGWKLQLEMKASYNSYSYLSQINVFDGSLIDKRRLIARYWPGEFVSITIINGSF